ncbi:MAG: hypothetical protein J7M18_04785 [Candidatus Eremiobacteraeota bacterium]|nr:hypothetical protein [Candidatus Eremiobacteraeota bacterium]
MAEPLPYSPSMRWKTLEKIKKLDQLDMVGRVISSINYSLCIKDDLCYIACRDAGY